jgi:hypothetical protein
MSFFFKILTFSTELYFIFFKIPIFFYLKKFGVDDELTVNLNSKDFMYATELFSLSGDQGDSWFKVRIPLGRITETFTISFDANRFYNEADYDLAIDDIKLINCQFPQPRPSCPSGYFTCERKSCVPNSRVCDLIDDCGDGSDEKNCTSYASCDFENGLCAWSNEAGQTMDWELRSGTFFYCFWI